MSRTLFRYKLNENFNRDELYLEHHKMTHDWKDFPSRVKEFDIYIKTDLNVKGILDYEEYDEKTKVILNKPTAESGPIRLDYERKELTTYDRGELEAIAKSFLIDPRHKNNEFLVKCIIVEQEKRLAEKEIKETTEVKDEVAKSTPKKDKIEKDEVEVEKVEEETVEVADESKDVEKVDTEVAKEDKEKAE